jgi:hypothetical protein
MELYPFIRNFDHLFFNVSHFDPKIKKKKPCNKKRADNGIELDVGFVHPGSLGKNCPSLNPLVTFSVLDLSLAIDNSSGVRGVVLIKGESLGSFCFKALSLSSGVIGVVRTSS